MTTPAVTASEVIAQLQLAGLLPFCRQLYVGPTSVSGTADLAILGCLRGDSRFYEDVWNFLHPEIPEPRTGFRAVTESGRSAFGTGSLQVVICTETGQYHADIDAHNTQDVVNIVGHLFGAVVPNWLKRLFSRSA